MTMVSENEIDRYVSFSGLDCDARAVDFMQRVAELIEENKGSTQWRDYFAEKLAQKAKMNHDDLFFIGAQMNTLHEFLESTGDKHALDLLWHLEQECC